MENPDHYRTMTSRNTEDQASSESYGSPNDESLQEDARGIEGTTATHMATAGMSKTLSPMSGPPANSPADPPSENGRWAYTGDGSTGATHLASASSPGPHTSVARELLNHLSEGFQKECMHLTQSQKSEVEEFQAKLRASYSLMKGEDEHQQHQQSPHSTTQRTRSSSWPQAELPQQPGERDPQPQRMGIFNAIKTLHDILEKGIYTRKHRLLPTIAKIETLSCIKRVDDFWKNPQHRLSMQQAGKCNYIGSRGSPQHSPSPRSSRAPAPARYCLFPPRTPARAPASDPALLFNHRSKYNLQYRAGPSPLRYVQNSDDSVLPQPLNNLGGSSISISISSGGGGGGGGGDAGANATVAIAKAAYAIATANSLDNACASACTKLPTIEEDKPPRTKGKAPLRGPAVMKSEYRPQCARCAPRIEWVYLWERGVLRQMDVLGKWKERITRYKMNLFVNLDMGIDTSEESATMVARALDDIAEQAMDLVLVA